MPEGVGDEKLVYQYAFGTMPQQVIKRFGNADLFAAGVINQKAINQNAQQILVLVAAQVLNIIETQFAFTTNEDQDFIEGAVNTIT